MGEPVAPWALRYVHCHCEGGDVPPSMCNFCGDPALEDDGDDCWVDNQDLYEDPPLYPVGKLAGMTVEQLQAEYDYQCNRQGRLGDAEYIDDRAVEETEMRCNVVQRELTARKLAAAG